METTVIILILIGIVTGAFTANLAQAKGYSFLVWFVAGFLFSLIALLAMIGMPVKERSNTRKS
jgi:hypothetical protein